MVSAGITCEPLPIIDFAEIASRDKSGEEENDSVQSSTKNLCTSSAGAACEDLALVDFGEIISRHKSGYKESDRVQYVWNPGYTLSGSE